MLFLKLFFFQIPASKFMPGDLIVKSGENKDRYQIIIQKRRRIKLYSESTAMWMYDGILVMVVDGQIVIHSKIYCLPESDMFCKVALPV